MTKPSISEPDCVNEAIQRITSRFNPLRIIMFGSRARGTARFDSDLDLLVVFPKVENKRHATIEIRAIPFLSNPIETEIIIQRLQESFNVEIYQRQISSSIPIWEEVIRLVVFNT